MTVRRLTATQWQTAQDQHLAAVTERIAGHQARRAAGTAHPIEDFLFTYYTYRPNQLRRWHPGIDVILCDAATTERASWPFYRVDGDDVQVSSAEALAARAPLLQFVRRLMRSSLNSQAKFGCFGMHEWAMVYRQEPTDVRHDSWPLRLSVDQIAATVEDRPLTCTHFDAFRFFTDAAKGLNARPLERATQLQSEQAGCLHAGMDLYKWAYKLIPLTSSDLVIRCFDLAREIRYTDMQASPYDFTDLGLAPIRVETSDGRAEYARRQRTFTRRAAGLRTALLEVCERGSRIGRETSRVGERD